jgi:hypothetical protein
MVDEILADEKKGGHVEVYIDDILVHMPDQEMNRYWVKRVLQKLKENQLFCREEKCSFKKDQVEFLGMEITSGTVKVSKRKVEAITKEEPPTNKMGVRRFLGLTNYHQCFIKDFSRKARPLHDLTWDVPFIWNQECKDAFNLLKEALSMSPVLALPRDQWKFQLETDASGVATGAILSQEQEDGTY